MRKLTLVIAAACVGSAFTFQAALADCQSDATAARSQYEAAGKALEAATKDKAKATPDVLCPLFRKFAAAEAGWNKFLNDNKDWCQVPEQVIKQSNVSLKRTNSTRDQVCQVAATGMAPGGPAKPPPQGSMSSALGITTGYNIGTSSGNGGNVFDTLNGNILK